MLKVTCFIYRSETDSLKKIFNIQTMHVGEELLISAVHLKRTQAATLLG